MKVVDAKVCADCDEVFEGCVCPACGNEQNIPVQKALLPITGSRVRKITPQEAVIAHIEQPPEAA